MPTRQRRSRPATRKPRPQHIQAAPAPLAQQEANPLADMRYLAEVGHSNASPLRQKAIQRLGLFGNTKLGNWLQRQGNPALDAFLKKGKMPDAKGKDLVAPTGLGGFNAMFDPADRTLYIRLNFAMDFQDGLVVDEGTGAVGVNAAGLAGKNAAKQITQLTTAAANLMSDIPDKAARVAEVKNNWQWQPAQTGPWMTEFQTAVAGAWGGKHHFRSKKWAELLASVKVVINTRSGPKTAADHVGGLIIKVPDNFALGAHVSSGDTSKANDSGMVIGSTATKPIKNLLHTQVFFENGSASLATAKAAFVGKPASSRVAATDFLKRYIPTFKAADPDNAEAIRLIGRASSTGSAAFNQTLSQQRAAAVEKYLEDNGLNGPKERTTASAEGDTGATDDADFRRVDMLVGSGEGQGVAAHEVGHVMGLDDEYATGNDSLIKGTGAPVGTPTGHDDLAKKMGGGVKGSVNENNDNIMSLGNSVEPQHYATFHYALEQVTSESWEYAGEGDAPVPFDAHAPEAEAVEGVIV